MSFSRICYQVRNRILKKILATSAFRVPSECAYESAVEKHINQLLLLSQSDFTIVDVLRQKGIFVTSLEALAIPSTPLMFNPAKKLLSRIPKASLCKKNEFVVHATSALILEYPELFFLT